MRLWENNDDWGTALNDGQQSSPSVLHSLQSLNMIDRLDKTLTNVYEDVITNATVFSSLDKKIQRFEIEDFSKSIKTIRKNYGASTNEEYTKEELQTRDFLNSNGNNLLGNFNDFIVSGDRKKRYQIYDEIPDLNYIAFRMMDVYIQNIFVKNMQTKKFLFIGDNPNVEFKEDQKLLKHHYNKLMKTIISYFEIEQKLKNYIVPKTLKYGNYFIEIVNFDGLENFINNSTLLQESTITDARKAEIKKYSDIFEFEAFGVVQPEMVLLENAIITTETTEVVESSFSDKLKNFLRENKPTSLIEENIFAYMDKEFGQQQSSQKEDFEFDDLEQLDIDKLKDIQLRGIDPSKVIIVEDESILYGYVIIEDEEKSGNSNEVDIYKRFLSDGNGKDSKNKGGENIPEAVDKMTKYIMDNLLDLIRLSNKNFTFKNLSLPEDSLYSIKSILYNKIKGKSKLKFRFLSSNNLINFSAPVNKYAPYGTSIFDPIVQPVKLYTLALISSIISRLSRASVVRKWNIEAGSKKNHAEIMETVKRDLKNKSITFDNLSNVKNIANVLTDFRDIATIKIDGQSFIDMEIVPMGDRSLPLNDANDLRNDLIAATGVPSVYLNIGDQADLREQLVNLNTSFANNILNWQTFIEEGMGKIFSIIFTELLKANGKTKNTFNISSYFEIKLTPPLVLQVQSNEALISSISNIISLFKASDFIVDPKQMYQLFIPTMDWDKLEEGGKKYVQTKAKESLIDNSGGAEPGM